ncbi:hypothetical protein TVNIR_3092 [Thioalkalivibrio nitratireducens DSM 14787]|uniref:Uncharacterized protein n=1 Tax=Thioalkalivibrio nitratireducens (strain DSM 14787 / UNIQEM 213 / ALEN2) TaxID=1255043 RepID=L0DYQ8_THIND|nr:hypothetical protein [Thioalkalivibrio nitratireducens]AGA34729.1 hypothetical protein TVNIR_3092 [Thioalkalivibrio nitratireducens DSM 14787]
MNPAAGVLVVLLGVLLFLSPVPMWVASVAPAWWWPFVAWAVLIATIACHVLGRRDP